MDSLLLWDILGNFQTLWKSLWSKWSNITNGLFLHMHLAVGYLSCCSHFPLPLFRTRQFTRVWFWSSFLVDCLSCQAPLHSINDTAASHYSLIFNGVEIKIDQIKKSRCKSSTQKMKLNTLHTKKSSKSLKYYKNVSSLFAPKNILEFLALKLPYLAWKYWMKNWRFL